LLEVGFEYVGKKGQLAICRMNLVLQALLKLHPMFREK